MVTSPSELLLLVVFCSTFVLVGLVRPRPYSPSLRKSNEQQSSCFVQVSRHRGFQFPRAPTTNNSTNTNNTAALFEPHAIQGFVQSFPDFVTVAYSPRAIMSVNVNMDMQKPPQKQAHFLPASVNNLSFARRIKTGTIHGRYLKKVH